MRRRFVLFFAGLLALAVLAVATLPWWLGAAAKSAAASRGLAFGRYERLGYARFALHDVVYDRSGVKVTASRVESDTPVLWGWRHWREGGSEVVAGSWQVEVARSNTPKPPGVDRGWVPLRGQLQRIAGHLDRWLPRARTGPGVVKWTGGEISAATARWAGRQLGVTGLRYRGVLADATAAFPAQGEIQVKGQSLPESSVALTVDIKSDGPRAEGKVTLWEQPATLVAAFGPRGWLPTEASFQAPEWSFTGEKLKLAEHYSRVHGRAAIEWRAGTFSADVHARSEPLAGKSAPPMEVDLKGQGDLQTFTIGLLNATLPGIAAKLTEPVTIERTGRIRESAARFLLDADLAQQPWLSAQGKVTGEARLVSGLAAAPVVEFTLNARDVTARDVALTRIAATGRLEWPKLNVVEGTIVGGEGEQLALRGGWDFRAKEVLAAAIEGDIRRASIARWLPAQPEFDAVKISLQAAGKSSELNHRGSAVAGGVKVAGVNPLAVTAEWNGVSDRVEKFHVEAAAGTGKITVGGSATRDAARVTVFELAQGGAARVTLAAPAEVSWKPQLQLGMLHLVGGESMLKVAATLGKTGKVEVSAREIPSTWLVDFVPPQGPPWHLSLLALVGQWNDGPMAFSLSAGASLDLGEQRTAAIMASARSEKDGVSIEALRATEGDQTVVNATGRVPITFTPGDPTFMHIAEDGSLRLDATVAPNAAFWQKLAAVSGVELKDPQAAAHLTGTWQRPEGQATLKAVSIAIDPKKISRPLPAIEELDVELTGDRSGVTLNRFGVRVEGQVVRAQGRLPVPDGKWGPLLKDPLAAARRGADLRLEVPDAEISVFTRFLPAVLAPKGRIQADVRYRNAGVEGFLKLRDAASRPLGPLGVLQEISADVALSGRKLALRGVTAKSGGQPVTLSGTVEMPEKGPPIFDLALKGENLPFVRQTGLLLRGDLDLKLHTPPNAQPRLSGDVRLRDSLFLADVRAFLPKGGGASPTRRPPYFAIETPPVNAWSLNVDVVGEEFLRMRTPVFAGVASARFRLTGTLGEPRAIGEIEIDEGNVRMPFASFEVSQAAVRLTEANPYEPEIYLRATGRRYGYDLTMEVEGEATQPNVVFTSSPALDAEQVLLMVMTGAAPSNEINKSATQRMASIGYFLGSSLLGSLGSSAADADKLSIASGEKVSRQGRETYDIEYRLSDRWTVTGEYNEYDEYNAGVKWRVFRGKKPGENQDHAKK